MSTYNFKFVVVDEIPTSMVTASNLSQIITERHGLSGWELVGVTAIPLTTPPGMLLTFQKPISRG
jgi:hypothetical protein